MIIKERTKALLDGIEQTILGKKKANVDRILTEIYIWQEISKHADERLKSAWKVGQEGELIPTDTKLRDLGKGTHIVVESANMSCVATVTDPRSNFCKEDFIAAIAKKYKIKAAELLAMSEKCKKPSAAPLSKCVLEAAS